MKIDGIPSNMSHKHEVEVVVTLDRQATNDVKEIIQTAGVTTVAVVSAILLVKKVLS